MRSDVIAALALSAARVGSGQVKTAAGLNPFPWIGRAIAGGVRGTGRGIAATGGGMASLGKKIYNSGAMTKPDQAGWAKQWKAKGFAPTAADPKVMVQPATATSPARSRTFNPESAPRAFSTGRTLASAAIASPFAMGAYNQAGYAGRALSDATGLSDTGNPHSVMGRIGATLGIDSPAERYQAAKQKWETQRSDMMRDYTQALTVDQDYERAKDLRTQMASGEYGGGSSTWNPGGMRMFGLNPFAANNANENMAAMKKTRGTMKDWYDQQVRTGRNDNQENNTAMQMFQGQLKNPHLDHAARTHITDVVSKLREQVAEYPNGVNPEAQRYWKMMQDSGAELGDSQPPTTGYNTGNYGSGGTGVSPPDAPSLMREYRLNPSEYNTPYPSF